MFHILPDSPSDWCCTCVCTVCMYNILYALVSVFFRLYLSLLCVSKRLWENCPFGMLQEKEEEHLCVLMSRWRKKGKDMRDRSCWQAMNVLLHITLCCSLHPQALYSVDVKLLFSIGNETACGEVAFTSSGALYAGALNALLVNSGPQVIMLFDDSCGLCGLLCIYWVGGSL